MQIENKLLSADLGGVKLGKESENKKAYQKLENGKIGEVKIADEVVAIIAGLAAAEVKGVRSMSGMSGEKNAKHSKNLSKGVKVDVTDSVVTVEISVILEYGYSIPETSRAIQEKIKSAIENMTGLHVAEVDVRIAGVNFENQKQ